MSNNCQGWADLKVQDGIAVVTVSNPPVNALGTAVRDGVAARMREAAADPAAKAVVLICAGLWCLPLGCSRQEDNHAPPTPNQQVQRIENNPYMSPAQKAAALEAYHAHQQTASSIGTARERAGKKPANASGPASR